jgi:hypothetical protein
MQYGERHLDYLPASSHGSILVTTRTEHAEMKMLDKRGSVPLRSLSRLGLLISSGTMRAFSLGMDRKQTAIDNRAPCYECSALFPHGEDVLIPDDLFALEPTRATKILKTAALTNSRLARNVDYAARMKVTIRPGIQYHANFKRSH